MQHSDAMIAAVARGVQVRLITEPQQYRLRSRMWHSWNVDRMYMGGVKVKHRAHAGLNHQKSVILYDQSSNAGDQSMVIFGSSNWTSPSAAGQVEHNIFTSDLDLVRWYVDQFERKWNNLGGVVENTDFVPLPPDAPTSPAPAAGAGNVGTSLTLKWYGGPWAHLYDLYVDTTSSFAAPMVFANLAETSGKTENSTFSYTLPTALRPGTTYYWKVVGKTMALKTKTSAVWSFTTAGGAPPPPPPGGGDIVVYALTAPLKVGAWRVESDATAAGGKKMRHPDAGAAKITTASTNPANYFEVTFNAEAGRGYRLWLRGKGDGNSWANDSVFVQFNKSVTSSGAATWRIGTTSAAEVNLEACSGCGVSGWGWQDNGYGSNVLGSAGVLLCVGPANAPRADPRGRVRDRSDRAVADNLPVGVARSAEERHPHPAAVAVEDPQKRAGLKTRPYRQGHRPGDEIGGEAQWAAISSAHARRTHAPPGDRSRAAARALHAAWPPKGAHARDR